MALGRRILAEGKTKIIWEDPEDSDNFVLIESKDDITAGDGERRDVIDNKGVYANVTTVNCLKLLSTAGVPTHFRGAKGNLWFRAVRLNMIPLELVVRRIATGSYLKRRRDVTEGTILPYVVEFFIKDDARHDPLVIYDFVSERIISFDPKKPLKEGFLEELPMEDASRLHLEIPKLRELAVASFKLLERAWERLDVTLVDLKIECGRTNDGEIIVGDVIDNDSWRIWPGGDQAQMKDKQVYRNLEGSSHEALGAIKKNYAWVAERTNTFNYLG